MVGSTLEIGSYSALCLFPSRSCAGSGVKEEGMTGILTTLALRLYTFEQSIAEAAVKDDSPADEWAAKRCF